MSKNQLEDGFTDEDWEDIESFLAIDAAAEGLLARRQEGNTAPLSHSMIAALYGQGSRQRIHEVIATFDDPISAARISSTGLYRIVRRGPY